MKNKLLFLLPLFLIGCEKVESNSLQSAWQYVKTMNIKAVDIECFEQRSPRDLCFVSSEADIVYILTCPRIGGYEIDGTKCELSYSYVYKRNKNL